MNGNYRHKVRVQPGKGAVERARGEVQRLWADAGRARVRVDAQGADDNDLITERLCDRAGPAQHRGDARQQHISIVGFLDVVIRAEREAQGFILFAPPRGQQNDGIR